MAMTRRVLPLASLNPYQGNWTIKVRVTSKGNLRSFRNARGEGNVFNVELTDEDVSISYNELIFFVCLILNSHSCILSIFMDVGYSNTSNNVQ